MNPLPSRDRLLSALDGRRLSLHILPTEKCNFRCTYCYEDYTQGKMSRATVNGIKSLMSRRSRSLQALDITWFGGEPLLAHELVCELNQHAQALMAERPGGSFTSGMTTNGYLLDNALLHRLHALGNNFYQITLDGPEEAHDLTRIKADGRGSFERIWQNLVNIHQQDLDLKVMIRVHVLPHTIKQVGRLLDQINTVFGEDERFSVYIKPIEKLGGTNDCSLEIIPKVQQSQILDTLVARLTHAHLRQLHMQFHHDPYLCYAAEANQLLIRANGDVGKCSVALSSPSNRLGRILEDGTLEVDQRLFRRWIRGFQSQNASELACPWQGLEALASSPSPQPEALAV